MNPVPTGNNLNAVTYTNGVFVAVGDAGTIATSPDGFAWQLQSLASQNPLNLVVGGNGRFVAAGPGGLIAASSDATNWIVQNSPTTNTFSAIGFGGTAFVLADTAGNIYSSPTGTNWNVSTLVAGGNVVGSFAYGNGLFVGAVNAGDVTSPDGTNWTFFAVPGGYPTERLNDVVFADGFFEATGISNDFSFPYVSSTFFWQSTNGQNWSIVSNGIDNVDAAYGAGVFVRVGDLGTISTSTNLQDWSETNWFNQSLFEQFGYTPFGHTCSLASSSNVVVSVGTYYGWWGPANVPYAAGYVSTNGGLSWNFIPGLNFTGATNYQNINGVTWGNGTFVAVGGGYNYSGTILTPGYIASSTDGYNWLTRNSGSGDMLNNAAFGGGKFVCVGASGTILTSPTGAAWSGRYSGSTVNLNGVAYGNGQYIVVGDSGTILSSQDSATWNGQYSAVTENLMQVAYGNGVFVGVGQSGTVIMSSDGTNWSPETSGVTADIDSVIYHNNQFVAPVTTGSPSQILTSSDGAHWNVQNLATPYSFETVCPIPSGLLFASTNFAMIKIASQASPQLVPSGMSDQGFEVKFFGTPGQSYFLQSSQDLLNWKNLTLFTNLQNPEVLFDSQASAYSNNFYRVVAP
ncbi:MAG TPA: hypothetical protein VGO67_05600 [Verrucomicrobiae bacterium]